MAIGALGLFGAAEAIWRLEADLSAQRTFVAAAAPYWSCDALPNNAKMAKVYAGAVIRHQGYEWHGLKWAFGYAAYQQYFRTRLSDRELAIAFVRTPSLREKNCQPVGARIA